MNLVYLVFGDELKNHVQTNLSLLTFLKASEINSVNIITDKPEFYNQVSTFVKIIPVSDHQLTEWKGEHDFFWRIKIKAIELIANMYKGEDILYVDSDTFLFSENVNKIQEFLSNGYSFMHLNEGKLSQLNTKTEKRMWNQVKNNTFGGVKITEETCMWNAGIISISGAKSNQIIQLTLDICDDMLQANVTRRLIEQFSFSVALNKCSKLIPAENYIGHYWGNKQEWNSFITNFILKSYFQKHTVEEQIEDLKGFDFSAMPIFVKESNTKKRIVNLLNYIFEKNNKVYIK
ncbi:MAG: hypothetical protein P4L28_10115 [Paludibacteraceae bacterium]|nr:hypothetical protein [Paludibacteraceae bacterium]